MRKVKLLFSIVYWTIILTLIVISASTALSVFKVPGGISLFSVQSGSMEPTINTGSVVLIQKQVVYKEGDIITFLSGTKKDTTTHRISAIKNANGEKIFTTKGDANRGEDRETIKEIQILGKMFFSAPYLGYVVSFAKTQVGFTFLIIVPAVIIIFSEILNIKIEILKIIEKRKITGGTTKILTLLLLIGTTLIFSTSTKAYLSDKEKSDNNVLQAGIWGTSQPSATPTTTLPLTPIPSPTPIINAGNVVINEVYYDLCSPAVTCGIEPDNEWVELYNQSNSTVDLSNWTLTDNNKSVTIPAGTTISASSFVVITPVESTWTFWPSVSTSMRVVLGTEAAGKIGNGLRNTGDKLILKNSESTIIDQISYENDTDILNPSISPVVAGHSIERDPDGIDSNTASDFVDRTTPAPGT